MRLLLVDSFALIRQSLAFMLAQQSDLDVIGDVGSAAEALHLATLHDVDLAIIEIELPNGDSVDLIRALRAARPRLVVLVLTGTTDISRRTYAIEAGASAVLHRSVSYDELLNAIRQLGAIWRGDIGTRAIVVNVGPDQISFTDTGFTCFYAEGWGSCVFPILSNEESLHFVNYVFGK